ncbi:CD109 antigen [Salmo salar]|uniref:CD109 antigen n=1 Tax=Salmo salar TaxID=8030 RepID=A0A1S3S7P7_SALSA|nr:CD109 antigen [Salmo salar]
MAPSPSYLISVPRVLRPGVPITLSVTILTKAVEVQVVTEIINGNNTVVTETTIIQGVSTELLVLSPIPDSELNYRHPYTLVVKGYDGMGNMVFTNSTVLRFNPKSSSTFIQTDKANYGPGQVVKIRAVSIYPDGKPYKGKIDIIIKDPKANMIRQWLSLDSVLGVLSKEFQLSKNPSLGKWTIVTSVNDVVSENQFNVEHYVLPRFEVWIEAPSVLHHDDTLWGMVTAKYMYGKPVRGHMNITYLHHFHGISVSSDDHKEIHGSTEFSFDVPDYQVMYKRSADNMYEDYENDEFLTIIVYVTESLTGLTYHSTMEVGVVKCRYNLAFRGYPSYIKPSLNFTAELKISTYNKWPLTREDQGKTVTISVTQQRHSPWSWKLDDLGLMLPRVLLNSTGPGLPPMPDEIPVQTMVLPVPADGVIPIHIQLSDKVATLTVDASFKDGYKMLQVYSSYKSPSKSYLQIQKSSLSPQVDVPLQLTLQSNFPLKEFHYLVMSRGQVLSSGRGSSSSLTLTPQESWAPLACIVVYCVHSDGEIFNDALHVPIAQDLKNKVSLSWSEDRARPADEVSLKVSVAEPGSLVGILVVDKATRWPRSHNDITKDMVLEEMAKYGRKTTGDMRMGDPYSIFTTSGIMVLTDAKLEKMGEQLRPQFPGEGIQLLGDEGDDMEQEEQEPRERRDFPETWLWLDTNTGDSTTAEFPLTLPDSITTWVATAFVMSADLGIGIIETPAKLTVFQDFFLSLNLPAFIIRGELLVVEVTLFNYLEQDLEVMVIVSQSDSFEFVFPDNEGLSMASTRTVSVGSQNGTSVLFPIRLLVLGEIPISVEAKSSVASDAVRRMVLVKPEGFEQSFSKTMFLELVGSVKSLSREVAFTFPADVVEGSQRAQVTAVGDILGPSITGLESLIQMPSGCGEQNMIHFAPNIYVIQYLTASGQADHDTLIKATSYMMKGYERELSYQRDDGSFSAFGDSDYSGSTWLSAFVLKCFLQARPFISIDGRVLVSTAAWLGAQQGNDGAFLEPGRVIHTELQGGLDGPVSLTAYVLMALLEDDIYKKMYASQVSGALMFLETRLALGISSNYSLCLATYALTLANSESAERALAQLMGRAEMKDSVPSWSSSGVGLSESWQPRSADIEMAAYLLLSLHKLSRLEEGFSLMKWLSQQRNYLGGYSSTQDTVIALQALSEYAAYSGSQFINLHITVNTAPSTTVASFHINYTNYLLYQSREIETGREVRLTVSAKGQGFALFQINVFYNLESRGLSRKWRNTAQEAFDLHIELFDTNMYYIHLYICTSLLEGQGINQTGMAILDVGLLSGFILAQDGIETNDVVRRVETHSGKVILYLDSVTTEEMCVKIPLVMDFKVANVQDATVLIYDYYEPRRKTVRTYQSYWRYDMGACSFCGEDCSQCKGQMAYVSNSVSVSHHCHHVATLAYSLIVLLVCSL